MGSNFEATSLQSGFRSVDELNAELQRIQDALDRVVSRFGEGANAMEVELDINDHRMLNVADGTLGTDGVNLNQVIRIATDIAGNLVTTSVPVETNSNPLTFNYCIVTGSQGTNNRTTFDLTALCGVASFNGLTAVVNGVVQIPGASYSVDGEVVTFSEPLEAGTDIMFIYGDLSPLPTLNVASVAIGETAVIATAGQTVFTSPTYAIAQDQLLVHIDGLLQSLTLGDYTETSTTSITLDEACLGGERVTIRSLTGV